MSVYIIFILKFSIRFQTFKIQIFIRFWDWGQWEGHWRGWSNASFWLYFWNFQISICWTWIISREADVITHRDMFFFCIQKTNASVLNIFICCFVCFFVILCHRGWKMKSFLFSDNHFGTLAFLFSQSCLCVTFTSWSTSSFGMLLSKLSNRNTHVCTCSIRMISFFTLQCELFRSCNVSNNASLVSARTGGGAVVNQMWTGLDRGRGVPKIPRFVRTSFMDGPLLQFLDVFQFLILLLCLVFI